MATTSEYMSTTPVGNYYTWEDDGTMSHISGGMTVGATTPASAGRTLFSVPDYVVFAVSLALPLCIGVFFFLISLRKPSTEEFLLGDRSMNFIVVALSIVASLLNGVFVIGQPAEIHYYGIRVMYQYLGLVIAVLVTAHVFVARYQKMMLTSAYQYVEKRYNKATRVVASLIFCTSVTIFLAVVLFVPALAFAQVTKLSIYATIVITGVICTLYTTIGGLKAVVWTDAIQMLILLGGLITIAIAGTIKVGGGNKVWELAKRDGRNNFRNFHFDPRERTSFWSQALGAGVVLIGLFISNQMLVQRFMAVPSPAKATASLYACMLMTLPLYVLIAIIGLVLHAYYADCDPLLRNLPHGIPPIKSGDQIFPLFLMELMGKYKGIPGLIMSSIFAAALSSVSSVINSLSAVCLEDFIDPAYFYIKKKKLTDRTRRWIAVVIVIFFGVVTIGLSFAADKFTSRLVQATGVIWGVLGGPLAGIFVMGFLMPFVNSWGAISGMISGLIIALWLAIGAIVHAPPPQSLPIGACLNAVYNRTVYFTPTTPAPKNILIDWYQISYSWFGVIGTGVCIIVGIIVSLATYGWTYRYRSSRSPEVMFSVADECCCCCPMSCRQCYRCGVKFEEQADVTLKRVERYEGDEEVRIGNGKKKSAVDVEFYEAGKQNEAYISEELQSDDDEPPTTIDHSPDIRNHNGHQNAAYALDLGDIELTANDENSRLPPQYNGYDHM